MLWFMRTRFCCLTVRVLRYLLLPCQFPAETLQVVAELLGTAEGCELYLLPPQACGCRTGEVLCFGELQAVGRLLGKTVIGVVAGGRVLLAPGRGWQWCVGEGDRVAVLALSWEC
jgi:hypothetical protein